MTPPSTEPSGSTRSDDDPPGRAAAGSGAVDPGGDGPPPPSAVDTDPDDRGSELPPRRLLRDNLVVASGTLLSRVTGVARLLAVWTLAKDLGDVYLLANNTPNIVYELILGGILTATLVPLFTEHLERRDRSATDAVVSTIVVALIGLTVIALVVAPALMFLYGRNVDPEVDADQFMRVGIILSLLFAPQVFFYGLMALGSALLNARHRFFAAAWAPVLNNVVVVAVLVLVPLMVDGQADLARIDADRSALAVLGLGTTAGIAGMAISLWPALRRAGVRLRFRPQLRHPAVHRALTLSGWTIGYVIANQIAAQVVNVLAVNEAGTVRAYQVGFIFFQLPHGLLAVSLMTTFQPDLARSYVRKDWGSFHARLLQGLRLLTAVIVPASIGYLTIGTLVARIAPDTRYAGGSGILEAQALAGFAPGLIGFSIYLFVLRAFYAVQDTRRPFWINCVENAINVVLALILVVPFSLIVGLTVAYSAAYVIAAGLALAVLLRRLPQGFDVRGFLTTLARSLGAAVGMAAVVLVAVLGVTATDVERIDIAVVVAIPLGAIAYVVGAYALGVTRDAGLPGPRAVLARLPFRRG